MSFNNFITALQFSFKKQTNCDVIFLCSDLTSSTGKSTIMAHKFILSLASDVFHTMFYGEAAKHVKDEEKSLGKVKIDDIQMQTFQLFLAFIYNVLIDFNTYETAAEFYYASHKYNAIDALEFINSYMLKEVNSKNAILFYDIACLYDNKELKQACVKIFSENTADILRSATFLKANPKIIEAIFKLNTLNINSEVQLINALERYIDYNEDNDPDIAEKVRPALSQIRFLTLDMPLIAKTTLLNPTEALQVIGCLSSDTAVSEMPKFVSSNNKKRSFTTTIMEIMRKLSPVYSDRYCNHCSGRKATSNHTYWNCLNNGRMYSGDGTKMVKIYQKYNHVWLLDYNVDDLIAVYEIYKSLGLVD